MGFFGSKNKNEKIDLQDETLEKVEREVIVHNMPSQEKIIGNLDKNNSSINIGGQINSNSNLNALPQINIKKDFKLMGFIIIFVGFLLIAAIVFLSYRFVISPNAEEKEEQSLENINQAQTNIKESEEELETTDPKLDKLEPEIDIDQAADNLDTIVPENLVNQIGEEDLEDSESEIVDDPEADRQVTEASVLIDSDDDGLYDEEELLLGTSIFLSDSDGDGYNDLSEINNNYNPSGEGILADSSLISIYRNFYHSFSCLYPNAWELKEVNDNLVIFEDNDSSLVQLVIMENSDSLSILNWYEANFPDETLAYDKLISKVGYEGVVSKNGLNVYLTDASRKTIFVFSYIPASSEYLNFINIFEMIYSSTSFFQ